MTSSSVAALADSATDGDRSGAIEFVLQCLDSDGRDEFLRGLSARVISGGDGADGPSAWLGLWLVSCVLEQNPQFVAADEEASKLVAAGKIGAGISGGDLRSRYA